MEKNKFILKSCLSIIVVVLLFITKSMYTSPSFSHVGGVITKNGGTAKYPALLGLDEDKYVIYASGKVESAFEGIKIVLEGEPEIDYNIKSYYPPAIDLGYHKFYEFENNTIKNISARERFTLIVSINPKVRIDKESKYYLKFYDLDSDSTVLTIPILFKELINFHISKKVRRPEVETRGSKNKIINSKHSKNQTNSSKNCCEK
ncbi:MAG: hypothetical protein WC868_11020 [Bacteroidales bacterium]